MSVSDPWEKIEWGADSEPRINERVPSSYRTTAFPVFFQHTEKETEVGHVQYSLVVLLIILLYISFQKSLGLEPRTADLHAHRTNWAEDLNLN